MRNEMVSEPQPVNVSGSAVGAASVTLQLDSQPVGVSYDPASSNGVWSASLLAGNGAHTLVATAHASLAGFNPSSTNSFTVISTNTINTSYDQNGNAVQRVFGDGRTQTLTWDGRGRLCAVNEQDSQTNGYTWSATYDAIGRRLRTIYRPITNGVNLAAQTLRVDSWYDPQVRYLEIAVEVNGDRTWKVYGPDVDGVYGGMQGLGGLEATIHESDGQATGVINNDYGDAVGTVTNAAVTWATLAFNGYGPIPGSIVPVLSTNLAVSSATIWRDKRIDPTGFYYFGARYYDPRSGRFLSPDPLGQAASDDLYSYCGGDPVNSFDPDGRCANPISTTGVVGAAGVLEQAAAVRYNYNADVQNLIDTGTYSAERDALRQFYNEPENTTALASAIANLYTTQQSAAGVTPNLTTPTVTAASVNNAAAIARYGGQGLIVLGTGMSVYTVATAPDPYLAMAQQGSATVVGVGGASVGAWAGAGIGAAAGSVIPVVGTAVGGVVGAIVGAIGGGIGGGVAGHALGTAAYNANYGPNSPWYGH
jgi:RHS repeat-associated protein